MEKRHVTIVVLLDLNILLSRLNANSLVLMEQHFHGNKDFICLEGYLGLLLMVYYLTNLTRGGECLSVRVLALIFYSVR